jgi:hypothetical protein
VHKLLLVEAILALSALRNVEWYHMIPCKWYNSDVIEWATRETPLSLLILVPQILTLQHSEYFNSAGQVPIYLGTKIIP